MKNITKAFLFLLSFSLFLPSCQSVDNHSGEDVVEDIKIREISFKLLTDHVYLNHNIMIQDFKILPASATNKNVKWSLKDADMGVFKNDFIYTTKAGDTTVICEATDGSNVKYELPVHILPLEAPTSMEVDSTIYGCVGYEITPEVNFTPVFDTVDNSVNVEILTPDQDIVEVQEDGTLMAKNIGVVNAKIASNSNPSLSKNIIIDVGNDLLLKAEPAASSQKYYSFKNEYEGHTTVGVVQHTSTIDDRYPSVSFTLPKPLNLAREKIKLDILRISGSSYAEVILFDTKGNMIKQKYGGDYTLGAWKTLTIGNDPNFDLDVYSFNFIVNTKKDGSSNVTSFAIDNLVTEETGPSEIVIKEPEINIDLENKFTLRDNFVFLPTTATSCLYNLEIISGEENVEIIDNKYLKGKKEGDATVRIISQYDETIFGDVTVHVLKFVPHIHATYHPAGGRIEMRLPKPINMSELKGHALALDFKMTSNGVKTFGFNYTPPEAWRNISNNIIIGNYNGNVVCNMGVIVTDKYDGWYTLIINEYYLHGDGKNVAEIVELVYAPEKDQTANGYIDWTTLRVVDQSFRIQKNVETYNKGEKAEHSAWDRFTIEKLSHGALAMDFKFQGEGEFKFAINNFEKNVIEEVTISGSEDNLLASRGKLEKGIDGWMTYTINFADFNGDIDTTNQIDTFKSGEITFDSVSIDWKAIRLVPTYE